MGMTSGTISCTLKRRATLPVTFTVVHSILSDGSSVGSLSAVMHNYEIITFVKLVDFIKNLRMKNAKIKIIFLTTPKAKSLIFVNEI